MLERETDTKGRPKSKSAELLKFKQQKWDNWFEESKTIFVKLNTFKNRSNKNI